jgi:hypothetical protein
MMNVSFTRVYIFVKWRPILVQSRPDSRVCIHVNDGIQVCGPEDTAVSACGRVGKEPQTASRRSEDRSKQVLGLHFAGPRTGRQAEREGPPSALSPSLV